MHCCLVSRVNASMLTHEWHCMHACVLAVLRVTGMHVEICHYCWLIPFPFPLYQVPAPHAKRTRVPTWVYASSSGRTSPVTAPWPPTPALSAMTVSVPVMQPYCGVVWVFHHEGSMGMLETRCRDRLCPKSYKGSSVWGRKASRCESEGWRMILYSEMVPASQCLKGTVGLLMLLKSHNPLCVVWQLWKDTMVVESSKLISIWILYISRNGFHVNFK